MDNRAKRIHIIEESFSKLNVDKAVFSKYFYDLLFEKSPEVKPLFSGISLEVQGNKLYAALLLLIENLKQPEELNKMLIPLGKRHIKYGVIEEHYTLFKVTLTETLAYFLKTDWNQETEQAWLKTLEEVTHTMQKGSSPIKQDKIKTTETKEIKNDDKFNLIQDSFKKIKPHKEEFATTFYEHLFVISPELEPLFKNTAMSKQSGKLYGALLLLVENIKQPEIMEKVLIPLGEKHKAYGAIDVHYPMIAAALYHTLEKYLKEDWTPELKEAWADTFKTVESMMLKGANTSVKKEKDNNFTQEKTTSKLSNKQKSKRGKKNGLISKLNNFFWEVPKWKIALAVTILLSLLVPIQTKFPIIKGLLEVIEPLSIILAVIIYVKDSPERKKQFHYQAWSIVDAANGIKNSYARIIALQDLCDDNVSLKGLELNNTELSGIELNGCDLSEVNFSAAIVDNAELFKCDLNNANLTNSSFTCAILTKANLSFANLHKANFSSANFTNANLMFTNMSHGNFSGANFHNAKLKGVNFEGAYLSGANLKGAEVSIDELEKAYLVKTIMPDGTIHE